MGSFYNPMKTSFLIKLFQWENALTVAWEYRVIKDFFYLFVIGVVCESKELGKLLCVPRVARRRLGGWATSRCQSLSLSAIQRAKISSTNSIMNSEKWKKPYPKFIQLNDLAFSVIFEGLLQSYNSIIGYREVRPICKIHTTARLNLGHIFIVYF